MILRRIKLTGFKKFEDEEFEFGPSINVFLGPNEAGKSTIQQAILTALYGVRDNKAGLLPGIDAARSWNMTDQCVIELEFESGRKEYRLVRDMDASRVKLFSRKSPRRKWKLVSDGAKKVDRQIVRQTGIRNAYVFNRTVSVSQTDVAEVDNLEQIGENIEEVFTGESRVGPDKAIDFIDRQFRKAFRKERQENPGRVDELEERLPELIEKLKMAREEEHEREVLTARLDELDKRIPKQDTKLNNVQNLKDRARQRREIEEKLSRARDDFRGIDRRIEQIRKAQEKLSTVDKRREEFGPIGDMDPEQLLTKQRELETKHWRAKNTAEQREKEIKAEQRRLDNALEARKELQQVEDGINGFSPLSQANLDEAEQQSTEIAGRIDDASRELSNGDGRLSDMAAHMKTLREVINRHKSITDPDSFLRDWHDRLSRRNETRGRLDAAERELDGHSGGEPSIGRRWILELAAGAGITLIGILISVVLAPGAFIGEIIAIVGAVGMMYAVGDHVVGRMKRREWRKVRARLSKSAEDAAAAYSEAEKAVDSFAQKLNEAEKDVEHRLMEHRDALREMKRRTDENEKFTKNRGNIEARRKKAREEGRELAEEYGCERLDQLRENCQELRKLLDARRNLQRNIRAIFGASDARDAVGLIDEAYGNIKKLEDEHKEAMAEVSRIESLQNELIERTGCKNQAELTRQADELKGLISKRKEAQTRLSTMLGGKTAAELDEDRETKKTRLAELSGRLDDNFAEFEPTLEQAEQWQTEYESLNEELEALRAERNQVYGRLKALVERPGPSPAELEGEKEFIEAEIKRGDETVAAARLAISILEEVKQTHHAEYLPQLEKATTQHFSAMTNDRYPTVGLARTWPDIFVSDGSMEDINVRELSQGTIDQLYFALRLAAGEALSRHTTLPLILDDPFVNFDPARVEQGMNILKTLAERGRQVILFTHDPRQAEYESSWREQGLEVDHVDLVREQ